MNTGPADLRPFNKSLPHVLLRARENAMRFFRPILADHDLTEQQWRVLRALHRPVDDSPTSELSPPDVGELADRTFLLGPSLTRILANLEHRELIVRQVDPADQRRSLIRLTEEGQALVTLIAPKSESQYARIEATFGQDNLAELFTLLETLAAMPVSAAPEGSP